MGKSQLMLSQGHLFFRSRVPVFIYHGLFRGEHCDSPAQEAKYWVEVAQFAEHLAVIRRSGYDAVTLEEVRNPETRKPNQICLTFDDGLASNYELAFPRLLEWKARAIFFVNTTNVGRARYMDWRQLKEMQENGMSIQSHSHDHVVLSLLPIRELRDQLARSRQIIEDHLATPVRYLAAPYGLLSARVVDHALEAGYEAVCSSWTWPANRKGKVIARTVIHRATGSREFRGLIQKRLVPYAKQLARTACLHIPKQVLLHFRPGMLGVRLLDTQA